MTVFLKTRSGTDSRDAAVLPGNKPLTVGRSPQNDVSFPEDALMSSRHLTIQLQKDGCLIKDLGSTNGTMVNGQPVSSALIGPGDTFQCGTTQFYVDWSDTIHDIPLAALPAEGRIDGRPAAVRPAVKATVVRPQSASVGRETDIDAAVLETSGYCAPGAAEIIRRFRLKQKIPLTPEKDEVPDAFLKRLQTAANGRGRLEFLAFALPRRAAVWWLVCCIKSGQPGESAEISEEDAEILDAVEAWLRTPSEKNRRAAMKAADGADLARPAGWTAMGAFFSHGSTAPENSPFVAAADDVCGKSILAGISLASVAAAPDKAAARRELFCQMGQDIAAAGLPIPGDNQ